MPSASLVLPVVFECLCADWRCWLPCSCSCCPFTLAISLCARACSCPNSSGIGVVRALVVQFLICCCAFVVLSVALPNLVRAAAVCAFRPWSIQLHRIVCQLLQLSSYHFSVFADRSHFRVHTTEIHFSVQFLVSRLSSQRDFATHRNS